MVAKKDLEAFLKSVNKGKILEYQKGSFKLEFSDESYYDLKPRMEDALKARLEIKRVEKEDGRNIVSFSVVEKSPADEILDIFAKYNEGTKPYSGYED
jgi:hypothetical protein